VIVFMLADCYECRLRYAVAPDPYFPGQWIFFECDRSVEQPTHICVGGLICLKGHTLEVISKEAVLTESGDWLSVEREHTLPNLN
jgi:hypothetical protein